MFNFFTRKNSEPVPFWFQTDIHAHVIPGVDDGSPDIETSLALINGLNELGIDRIIATPHIADEEFPNTAATLREPFRMLCGELSRTGSPVALSHTAEYRIDDGLVSLMEKGELIPYPGNYILIENQWLMEPMNLDQLIFDLQVRGLRPILAHPERFTYYHTRPGRLQDLHSRVPFQINMLSLAGFYGKPVKAMAEHLARNGMIDYLGTDIHRMAHIEALRTYLTTRDALTHRKLTRSGLRNDLTFPADSAD